MRGFCANAKVAQRPWTVSDEAISGGPAPIIMNDKRRKNTTAIRHPAAKPNAF
jgi:hypothetical protein